MSTLVRAFVHTSEAWYAPKAITPGMLDEVLVGLYREEGGSSGEFAIRWTLLRDKPVPRLEVCDDAWAALGQFEDLLKAMALIDNQSITPKDFCEMLRSINIADYTPRVRTREHL
jgi:hypothetical protein